MKVEELIDKLKNVPQDVDVILKGDTWYYDDCHRHETRLYEGNVEQIEYDSYDNKVYIYGEDNEE